MKKNPNWPKYVGEANGRVVYRPVIKGEPPEGYGVGKQGFLKPPIKLGKVSDPDEFILRKYIDARDALANASQRKHIPKKNTLSWIMEAYFLSPDFKALKPSSKQWYEVHLRVFLAVEVRPQGCSPMPIGSLFISSLTLPGINRIKAKLIRESEEKGEVGTSYINGHMRAARAMIAWALNNLDGLGTAANPFRGIKLATEAPRDRYVTDDEYMEQYLFAVDHGPEYLPLVFEHAYLLAGRSIEIAALTTDDVLPDGYLMRRTKNSKDNIITYTPRLEAARDAAFMYRKAAKAKGPWLIPSTVGNKLTKDTLQSAMAELKKRMREAGKSAICWNLHDLKRKGISDAKDARIGGHKSDHIRQRYMVKLEKFDAPA